MAAATGLRWLARRLLHREANILAILTDIEGFARVRKLDRDRLVRSFIDGEPMQRSRPTDPTYFKYAAQLLRKMHRAGVVHNDLAKEPNFLVRPDGRPAIVDFQIAWSSANRSKLFRLAAREDLRHLLKHKRTYCPASLTKRELDILDKPALISRIWMLTGKKLYLLITRGLLGWKERNGAEERS